MSILTGKLLVAQGGGPTAVINQSFVGAVLEARKFPQITRVYGAVHGVRGIINEDFWDLTQETTNNLEKVAATPSSGLLSTRDKPDHEYCLKIFKVLQIHDIRYFFYIGGNDSADTVKIVNEEAERVGYDMRCIHIPKTIDNDLVINDHTPGYPSAARFVAQAMMGVNFDNRALPGVYISVIMGRHAGFLTAAASLARKYPDDGPHLVFIPEYPFSVDEFLGHIDRVYKKYGRCMIAVSEGIQDKDKVPIITKLVENVEKDDHGNIQLSGTGALGDLLVKKIKDGLNIKRVRSDTLGYLQRAFMGVTSDVDATEAREVGEKAAQFALWNNVDGSITIHRTSNYSVDYKITPLADIAGKTKHMPPEFYNQKECVPTSEFFSYARPLMGSGFPQGHRIRGVKVPKLLGM